MLKLMEKMKGTSDLNKFFIFSYVEIDEKIKRQIIFCNYFIMAKCFFLKKNLTILNLKIRTFQSFRSDRQAPLKLETAQRKRTMNYNC